MGLTGLTSTFGAVLPAKAGLQAFPSRDIDSHGITKLAADGHDAVGAGYARAFYLSVRSRSQRYAANYVTKMSEPSGTPFVWSDAWVLLAAGLAAVNGPPLLASVIRAADAINHAIITKDELDGAIGRLQRVGLLAYNSPVLVVTAAGEALLDRAGGRSLVDRVDSVATQLAAERWTSAFGSALARRGDAEILSEADYAGAVSAYLSSSAKIRRSASDTT